MPKPKYEKWNHTPLVGMSGKKARERQQFLVFLLVLYVMGFAFLYSNIAVGVILLGLAFFLTMGAFPPVLNAIRTTVKWIIGIAQKRAAQAHETAETGAHATRTPMQPQPSPPLVTEAQGKSMYDNVVSILRNWQPARKFNDERQGEIATEEHLNHFFHNQVRRHKYREDFESDLEIGDIGIEIKVLYKTSEMQRLGGQLMAYCQHFNHVIALIFNYNRIDLGSYKNQWQKHFGSKVEVIEKQN
jgi:hypothetical protein